MWIRVGQKAAFQGDGKETKPKPQRPPMRRVFFISRIRQRSVVGPSIEEGKAVWRLELAALVESGRMMREFQISVFGNKIRVGRLSSWACWATVRTFVSHADSTWIHKVASQGGREFPVRGSETEGEQGKGKASPSQNHRAVWGRSRKAMQNAPESRSS